MSLCVHPPSVSLPLQSKLQNKPESRFIRKLVSTVPSPRLLAKCMTEQRSSGGSSSLQIGSPVIVVEAPATLKTADSMPSLKVNLGQVKAGDVGRIVARKPKDVWAVRLKIGTYLLDGKHFEPLDLDE